MSNSTENNQQHPPLTLSQILERPEDRSLRVGGIVIPDHEVFKWHEKLYIQAKPNAKPGIANLGKNSIIFSGGHVQNLQRFLGLDSEFPFLMWGNIDEPSKCMIPTQWKSFPGGHSHMKEDEIPKFVEGGVEARARQYLRDQGMEGVDKFEFETILKPGRHWLTMRVPLTA